MSSGSATHEPSSENTRTFAREVAIAPISDRCVPCSPCETAPIGRTVTYPASSPSACTCSTTPAVSATGDELAIAFTAVKPPAAAAREPDRTVSDSS